MLAVWACSITGLLYRDCISHHFLHILSVFLPLCSFLSFCPDLYPFGSPSLFSLSLRQTSHLWQRNVIGTKKGPSTDPHFSYLFLSSYLPSMRTQRSLKCRCLCFFCLFLFFFFNTFFSPFSSSSRLSGGSSIWGNKSSSRGRPWSSSLWGSSWRNGSRRGDSSWWSSNSGLDLLNDKHHRNMRFFWTKEEETFCHRISCLNLKLWYDL